MARFLSLLSLSLLGATPAAAASGPFFSLFNTNFVVLVSFIIFVAALVVLKVPGLLAGMLDKRAEGIKSDLDEAQRLRDEAQEVYASFEQRQKEIEEQSAAIIAHAQKEAEESADMARKDLEASIARRLKTAEEQISSAEAAAIREIRDTATRVAIAAAQDVIASGMSAQKANSLIDQAIDALPGKLN